MEGGERLRRAFDRRPGRVRVRAEDPRAHAGRRRPPVAYALWHPVSVSGSNGQGGMAMATDYAQVLRSAGLRVTGPRVALMKVARDGGHSSVEQLRQGVLDIIGSVSRVRRSQGFRKDVTDACKLQDGARRTSGDDAGTFRSGLQEHAACTENTDHLMRDCRILQGNLDEILLRVLDALTDCLRHLACLAEACADLAL